jgi:uncharacterized membrane protein YagU involved in acid resistance
MLLRAMPTALAAFRLLPCAVLWHAIDAWQAAAAMKSLFLFLRSFRMPMLAALLAIWQKPL